MSGSRVRGRLKRFKGIGMPSYFYARVDTSRKTQWLPHCGTRAQLRNLRNRCRRILDSKDPVIVATGERVLQAVKDEPNPAFGALHLIAAGLDASEQTGVTWVDAMTYLLNKFDAMERNEHASVDTGR